ncbi:MAG: ATP-grasp domain-containing protein [Candidatus Woykebacteria bacterium]
MRLYEYEGKELFEKEEIPVPKGKLVSSVLDVDGIELPAIAKAQTLSGKRGRDGLIVPCKNETELKSAVKNLLSKKVAGQKIDKILIEKFLFEKSSEFYLAITYDTSSRGPVALVSKKGGVEIEELAKDRDTVKKITINPIIGLQPWMARQILSTAGFSGLHFLSLTKILLSLWKVFEKYDARLVEVNPLIETEDEEFYAADAKIILDDDADFRRGEVGFPPRDVLGRKLTESEMAAKGIDKNDHRGSAGSTYIELDGDIGVIAAGGGGSLVNMDALVALGGRPANYTEHSGNPPREKLKKLTELVLSKKGLNGCWFVGATANFTDIYETLEGFVEGLRNVKPKPTYPIVIRRGGPRYEEAFEMLRNVGKKEGFDFHIFGPETPMTSTAKTLVTLVNKYKKLKER